MGFLDSWRGFLDKLAGRSTKPVVPSVTPPTPTPTPTPPGQSTPPPATSTGQMLWIGLTRWWSREDAEKSAAMVRQAGAHGRSYELLELEPGTITNGSQMDTYMRGQIVKIGPHIQADMRHGLTSKIYWFNTNAQSSDQPSASQHKAMIDHFCGLYAAYLSNMYIMAMNEDDSNTSKATIDAVRAYWKTKPVKGIILYERDGERFNEFHPRRWGDYSGGANRASTIFAPDNGPPLDVLTEGDTFNGSGKPVIAKWVEMVRTAWGQGKSVDCYNFLGALDPAWVMACCQAAGLGGAVAPVPVPSVSSADAIDIRGATLLGPHGRDGDPASASITCQLNSARMDGGKLWLDYATVPNWPTDRDGTTCQNYIYWRGGDGKIRGGWFERSGNGRRDRLLHNIKAGYLGEQPLVGSPCWTCTVRRNFSERTNVVSCGRWA